MTAATILRRIRESGLDAVSCEILLTVSTAPGTSMEVADRLDVARSSVYEKTSALEILGWVEKVEGKTTCTEEGRETIRAVLGVKPGR